MENKVLSYEEKFKDMRDRGNKFVEEYAITVASKYDIPEDKQLINLISASDMHQLLAIGKEIDNIIKNYERLKRKAEAAGILQIIEDDDDYYFPLGRD